MAADKWIHSRLVRPVEPTDAIDWIRMRQCLWPLPPGEHARRIAAFFNGDRRNPQEVFIVRDESGYAIGFAEVSIRIQAQGCRSGRVAYLEAWYVREEHRRRGAGAALLAAAEKWGRVQQCTEVASETEVENNAGISAHGVLGFSEVGRVICFRKEL